MVSADTGASNGDDGGRAAKLSAHQLVWAKDRKDFVHPGIGLERQPGDDVPLAADGDDGHDVAGGNVPTCAGAVEPFEDTLDLL